MDDPVKPLTSLTGSAGDIWRAWEVVLDGAIYYVQESRIGYQVLRQPSAGGRKAASPAEKQRVIEILKAFLNRPAD